MTGQGQHDAVELAVRDVLHRYSDDLVGVVQRHLHKLMPLAVEIVMEASSRPVSSPDEGLRLMGQAEIVEFLGLRHRQQLADLRKRISHPFPASVAELKMGPVWLARDVEEWAKGWTRKQGRPRKGKGT